MESNLGKTLHSFRIYFELVVFASMIRLLFVQAVWVVGCCRPGRITRTSFLTVLVIGLHFFNVRISHALLLSGETSVVCLIRCFGVLQSTKMPPMFSNASQFFKLERMTFPVPQKVRRVERS